MQPSKLELVKAVERISGQLFRFDVPRIAGWPESAAISSLRGAVFPLMQRWHDQRKMPAVGAMRRVLEQFTALPAKVRAAIERGASAASLKLWARGRAQNARGDWSLWEFGGEGEAAGYLITSGAACLPVAVVNGKGRASLARAIAIRQDNRKAAAAGSIDLRERSDPPAALMGVMLWPVDRQGRRIANDDTFAGGMYVPAGMSGVRWAFLKLTHGGVEAGYRTGATGGNEGQEKSGSLMSLTPHSLAAKGAKANRAAA